MSKISIKSALEKIAELEQKAHDLQSDLHNLQHEIEESGIGSPDFEELTEGVGLSAFNVGDVFGPLESVIKSFK